MNVPLWISPKRSALTLSFMGLGEPFGMVIWAADAPRPRWKVILPTAIVERYLDD